MITLDAGDTFSGWVSSLQGMPLALVIIAMLAFIAFIFWLALK